MQNTFDPYAQVTARFDDPNYQQFRSRSVDDQIALLNQRFPGLLTDYHQIAEDEAKSERGMFRDTFSAVGHGAAFEVAGMAEFIGASSISNYFQDVAQNRVDAMSDRGRELFEAELSVLNSSDAPLGAWWLQAASGLGQIGASIGSGGVVGAGARRGAMGLARRVGTGERGLGLVGKGSMMTGMGATGGSASTGQAIIEARQAYDDMTWEEKMQSPTVQRYAAEMLEREPDIGDEELVNAVNAAVNAQIGRDIRTDAEVLAGNFVFSFLADPVIAGVVGRRAGSQVLQKLGRSEGDGLIKRAAGEAVRRGGQFTKGAIVGAPSEIGQDVAMQRGVARSLEGIDPDAEPNAIDWDRAAVSAVLGGVAGGGVAAITGDTSRIRDPDADEIRDTNPALAEGIDSLKQDKDRHEQELGEALAGVRRDADQVAPDSAASVTDAQVAAVVERMRATDNQGNATYVNHSGQQLSREQAESLVRADLGRGSQASLDTPAVSRRVEREEPPRPESSIVAPEQRGDLEQPAYQRFAAEEQPQPARERVQGDTEQPAFTRARGETLEDSQLETDVRMMNEEFSRLPRDGQLLPGEQTTYSTSEQTRSDIDGEVTRSALPDRSGMPMRDRRAEQDVREQLERRQPAIEQSETIFARGEALKAIPEGVTVKQSGSPFASERSALSSLRARQAKEQGDNIQAIQVPGGWGWRTAAPPANTTATNQTTDAPSQEGVSASEAEESAPATESNEATTPQPASTTANQIDDFGEKIGGARKDVWTGFKEAIDTTDTNAQPLSKSFPQPDYTKLKDAGADPQALAAVAALRHSIPNKPRKRGLSRWAQNADSIRRLAAQLLDGSVKPGNLLEYARAQPALRDIANALPVIAEADSGVMKQAAEFTIKESSGLYVDGKPFGNGFIVERNGRGDWDTVSKTLEEAQSKLRKKIKALKSKSDEGESSAKKSSLKLYQDRRTDELYIGWKGASKVIKVQAVDSVAEGRELLGSGRADLEAKLEQLKKTPSMRNEQNADRVGEVRADGDVTPELFSQTFGFRGVEFGNWVGQGKRQQDLNQAFEALHDLAEVLGVPPQALSLNGELGLAFGARGKGGARPAAAHYERSKIAINLTKKDGAGSLAHEWFHALDNYLSRERSLPGDYVSDRPYTLANDPTRKEMLKAFKGINDAIIKSGVVQRSSELDGRRSKRYWSTNPELTARAFETYVISKLGDRGWSNDYLANVVDEGAWNAIDDGTFPYPTSTERGPINDAFDTFFDTVETRKTTKGVKFFSKSNSLDKKPAKGVSADQVKKLADSLIERLNGASGIKVKVFDTQQQAEKAWKMSLDGALVKGAFDEDTNTAYIVSENVTSLDEARQTLAHEVIAHGGLQNVIGESDYQDFLNRLKSTRGKKTFEEQWREIDRDYDGMSEDVKAEELFAKFVETQPEVGALRHWLNSIRNWLRKALGKVGLVNADTDADVMRSMMESIVDGFKVGHASMTTQSQQSGTAELAFSKTNDTRTAEEKIGQGIIDDTLNSKFKETVAAIKTRGFWERVKEGLFDGLHGIKQAEEAAGITDPNQQGYVSARLSSGIGDMLHALFNRGALEWRNGVVSTKEGTMGLMEAFGMLPEGKLNDWLAWMAGNRAEQLATRGKENNLTAADIATLKGKAQGNEAVFEQVRQEYNKINKATLELARESGLLNAEQIAAFDTEWYVPFFRDKSKSSSELTDLMATINSVYTKRTGIVGQSAQIKELLGGKSSTKDLLTNIIQRQVSLIDAAIKNNAAREVATNLDGTNFMTKASDAETSGEFTRQELASRQKVRIMEHGKPVHYLVHDAGLLRGLMQVHDVGSKAIFNRVARSAKRFLTTGVTLSPDFIMRNFIRDASHAWMVNKDGAKLGTDTWTGLKSSWKQGDEYWNLIAGGAAFQGGYIHGADPEAAQQQIRRHLREKGFTKSQIDNHMSTLVTTKDGLLKAFEKYRQVSDRLENSNRMTVYNRAKAAGKSERQALFEAKDLMDYSMKGNFQLMSTFIDMLPFFNARVQGLYKLGRASAADGNDQIFKVLSRDLAFKGMKVAGFSLALAALNGDDERYKELAEWDKDAHWHFFMGDQHWRVPKPFELGIIFGTIPERMFNFASGNQTAKDARESVGHAVWNTLALNPIPQVVMPVAELMMNKSMFTGAPIESLADKRREAVDRYGENTSDTARLIGQLTGLVGLSPKQVEHLVNGYAGTLGGYTLGASDVLARLMTGREKASTPIADYPIVRTIYQGGKTQRNTMYQQRFFESLNAAREAYGSYQLAIDEHDQGRAQKLYESRSSELTSRRQLERIQRQVSDINSQMRVVQRDPNLSRKEKRERLDQLQLTRNQIYQNAYLSLNLKDW